MGVTQWAYTMTTRAPGVPKSYRNNTNANSEQEVKEGEDPGLDDEKTSTFRFA